MSAAPSFKVITNNENQRVMKSVMCFGPKGGLGKTTAASSLAVCAARDGLKVLAVDFDDEQQSLTRWYKDRREHPDYEALAKFDLHNGSEVTEFREVWRKAQAYDFVVFDMQPTAKNIREALDMMFENVDLILLPCGPSKKEHEIQKDWLLQLRNRYSKKTAYFLNRVDAENRGSYKDAIDNLKTCGRRMTTIIPAREDVKKYDALGLCCVEIEDAKGSVEYEALWNEVRVAVELWKD